AISFYQFVVLCYRYRESIPDRVMKDRVLMRCFSSAALVLVFCAISLCRAATQLAPTNSSPENGTTEKLPLLNTAEQVHRLTREEASKGYRASIRGVVTCSLPYSEAVVV